MKLTTQSRYGVRAVFDIAYHSEGRSTLVKEISRRQEISPRYLEQIFQRLKRAGIVGSRTGPSGGYHLMKNPAKITVGQILRITEGDITPVACVGPQNAKRRCDRMGQCVTSVIWREAGKRLKQYLDSVTTRDLCEMAQKMGLKKDSSAVGTSSM